MVNYFWKEGVPIRGLQCVCYCPDHFRDKSVTLDGKNLTLGRAGGKWQFPFHRWAKEAQRVESTYPGSAEWEFELASHSQAPFCTISGMAEEPSQLLSCGFCSQR